jgi:hypothetical protein
MDELKFGFNLLFATIDIFFVAVVVNWVRPTEESSAGNNTLLKPAELKSPNSNFGTPRQLSSLSLGNQEREGHGFRRAARSAKVSALAAEVLSHRFRLLLRSGSPSLGLEGMIEEVSQDARGDEHHSESE